MKKILLLSVALILTFTGVVYALNANGDYKGNPVVKVTLNGVELTPEDVPGMLYDGRTMIPLALLRQIGFTVEWDSATQTANVIPPKVEPPKVEPDEQANEPDKPTDETKGDAGETPKETPKDTPSETPKEPEKPDNSAACSQISDSYRIQLLQLGELNTAAKRANALIIEYQRDQALSAAGCN